VDLSETCAMYFVSVSCTPLTSVMRHLIVVLRVFFVGSVTLIFLVTSQWTLLESMDEAHYGG